MAFLNRTMLFVALALVHSASGVGQAQADGLLGTWERSNGLSRVRFAPCGEKFCGTVVWLKEPKFDRFNKDPSRRNRSVLGMRVFFDIVDEPNGGWIGRAYNTDDGEVYGGRITQNGDELFTTGCVIAGLICTTVRWKRVQ
jgi:uncharacterized protein (DUF2147 family)